MIPTSSGAAYLIMVHVCPAQYGSSDFGWIAPREYAQFAASTLNGIPLSVQPPSTKPAVLRERTK
jgi:hypothetical protein